MTGDPLVSIRCLVYNHEPYLRQCLDGFVMQQTSFPFEAIVHDDASTDGSAAIIREYAEKYPDIIKPIYETENQWGKHDGSLRRVMDAAMHPNSKYVALCEGDDFWTDPNKLQMQVDVLENHVECTIVFSSVKTIDRDGNELNWSIPQRPYLIPKGVLTLDDYMFSEFYHGSWTFHTSTFVYKRCCLKLHNELHKTVYKNYPYGDQPLLLSCLFQGKGFYIPKVTGYYRVLSGGYNSQIKDNIQLQIDSYQRRIDGWKDVDNYTSGKYSRYISRNCDRFQFMILETKYQNGLMGLAEKCVFLFYDFWKIRSNFSTFKKSMKRFVSFVFPNSFAVYYAIKNKCRLILSKRSFFYSVIVFMCLIFGYNF